MPSELPKNAIEGAEAAVVFAQLVRKQHRRRTVRTAKARQRDIDLALSRLKKAMKPLKSEIGRFSYGPQTTAAEANRNAIRQASTAIQAERRKLWKMQNHTTKEIPNEA